MFKNGLLLIKHDAIFNDGFTNFNLPKPLFNYRFIIITFHEANTNVWFSKFVIPNMLSQGSLATEKIANEIAPLDPSGTYTLINIGLSYDLNYVTVEKYTSGRVIDSFRILGYR